MGIIQALQLQKNDVKIFYDNNRFCIKKLSYNAFNLTEIFSKTIKYTPFYKSIFKNKYALFDNIINDFINDDSFILYLPHIYGKPKQALINHSGCVQVNFIEEGLVSYYYNDFLIKDFYYNLPLKKQIKEFFKRKLFYLKLNREFSPKSFFDISVINKPKQTIYYGLSAQSFNFVNSKNKVTILPNIQNTIKYFESNTHLIVLDNLVEVGLVDETIFLHSFKYILDNIDSEEIYLKYHPSQSSDMKKKLIQIITNKRIKIIPDDIGLEEQFLTAPPHTLNVYGFISSLLLYASIAKQNVKSFSYKLENDESYKEYITKINFNFKTL